MILDQKNLEKTSKYDWVVLLGEHFGAWVGDVARLFLSRCIEAAKKSLALT
jgi:hypothetical protein